MRVVTSLACCVGSLVSLTAQISPRDTIKREALGTSWLPSTLLHPKTQDDLKLGLSPFVLQTPSNIQTRFVYDPKQHLYLLATYYQGRPLGTPLAYTLQEFMAYLASRQDDIVYRHLNDSNRDRAEGALAPIYDPRAMRRRRLGLEQIFGKGGLQLRYNGTVELNAGLAKSEIKNPSLNQGARENSYFDFSEQIQVNAQAKLGTKLKLDLNYNSKATFEQDAKKIKLSFEGEDDDIIKQIELGQVSMTSRNSLIGGTQSAFGVFGKLQFGPLDVGMLISQQRSISRRLQSQGNNEIRSFEMSASDYDEGRHFFLGDFFRSRYDVVQSKRPEQDNSVHITRLEVWITNKRNKYEEARNFAAFADLGEAVNIHNSYITSNGNATTASNTANSLYAELRTNANYRDLSRLATSLPTALKAGLDYDKEESARKLAPSEYVLNEQLGYISLVQKLQSDEILAVAYEYNYLGKTYRVGEFASDQPDSDTSALFLKLLKGRNMRPASPYWHYMMRNVYALGRGISRLRSEGFRLDILYRNDERGIYQPYLSSNGQSDARLLDLLDLDKTNSNQEAYSDGRFDYLAGATIDEQHAWIYLPSVEPFGQSLKQKGIDAKYRYDELYQLVPTAAKQLAEKNKFLLRGSFSAQSEGELSLGSSNVSPGSVKVRAGGQTLTEGVDYTVDYMLGVVRITNEQILASQIPIDLSLEEGRGESNNRRTVLGIDLNYNISKYLRLGATAMSLSEMPLDNKLRLGNEAIRNSLWGANLAWKQEIPWLQRLLGKLSLSNISVPSNINLNIDIAQLNPGQYRGTRLSKYSYLDDFDNSRTEIDLRQASAWYLSSTPHDRLPANRNSLLESGYGRGHLSWFSIDPIFTRAYSDYTPAYIRRNPTLISEHYVREVDMRELYPNRESHTSLVNSLATLNLRFYPQERGMYNLNTSRLGSDGLFLDPENSWGGIMRKLDLSDFEASNVEYLEFWLMDPNISRLAGSGGDLYFNIGDISEDILKDGNKFFENGLPIQTTTTATRTTEWGLNPTTQSIGYAFDSSAGARSKQDVGLNGLSSLEERQHTSYADYIARLRNVITASRSNEWQGDTHSPLNDPAGDDFEHYLSSKYDDAETPILDRYKYYNGLEGNSSDSPNERINASRSMPDVEDINLDNSMNELDQYYEYKISLRPQDLQVGSNHIVASRNVEVRLANGTLSSVRWYQFRIPLASYDRAIGGISDMRSMRFMRMYLAGCREVTDLRFGSLRLLRGDWRVYSDPLYDMATPPTSQAKLSVGNVNIEEHADRSPINYVLPPGLTRSTDVGSASSIESNEQALSLKVQDLAPGDARAVYRNTNYDLRRYRRLQLYTHAEQLAEDDSGTLDDELEVFMRLGSDYQSNYYEYTAPLKLTQRGQYTSASETSRREVWKEDNFLDLDLDQLVDLKRERNRLIAQSGGTATNYERHSTPAKEKPTHSLSIVGNPSLSHIRTMMIGVRNRSGQTRNLEVWVNELRLNEAKEESAWAMNTNLGLQLSDFASLHLQGSYASAGFGSLDQSLMERQQDNRSNLHLTSQLELGKLLPKSTEARIPLHISISKELSRPEFSPKDEDIKLSDALNDASEQERSQLEQYSLRKRLQKSINLMGINLGIRSKQAMPYDPANIRLNFSHTTTEHNSPEFEYQRELSWLASLQYDYTPTFKALKPFAKIQGSSAWARYLQGYGINLWPKHIGLSTTMQRQYEEEQVRQGLNENLSDRLPASFSNLFVWQRKMNLSWLPIPSLNISLQTGTDARIEGINTQVNRELNPDGYALWREAVDKSIADLGTPQRYSQQASASYVAPTSSFKALSWLQASASYNSQYQWDLGAQLPQSNKAMPNSISNSLGLDISLHLRLRSLYQLFPRLARIEREYAGLGARTKQGKNAKDKTQTSHKNSDNKLIDKVLYSMMMLKDLSLSIRNQEMTHLPGYLGSVGDLWGQRSIDGHLRPGLGFAFGFGGEDFVGKMAEQGLLTSDASTAMYALVTRSKVVDLKATIQPIKDLTIQLSANHTATRRSEVQYMYAGSPLLYGGDLQMTTIGLQGFWQRGTAENGYLTSTLKRFLEKRDQLHQQHKSELAQLDSRAELATTSPVLLLTAFRNTYLKDKSDIHSGALPSLGSMLPNWSVTYSGLGKIPALKRAVSNITLKHAYRGIYRINSYDSFASWQAVEGTALGIVRDDSGNAPRWAYPEDIASVSLSETFFPLIGADVVFLNGLTLTNEWRRSRTLSLSLGSARMIESVSDEWSMGFSYRLGDLSSLWRPRPSGSKQRTSNKDKGKTYGGLILKADYSSRYTHNLIFPLSQGAAQATSAYRYTRLNLSADYELSQAVTLRAYYELNSSIPYVSMGNFPTYERRYGLAIKLNLKN